LKIYHLATLLSRLRLSEWVAGETQILIIDKKLEYGSWKK
jgi:hypothetical protein